MKDVCCDGIGHWGNSIGCDCFGCTIWVYCEFYHVVEINGICGCIRAIYPDFQIINAFVIVIGAQDIILTIIIHIICSVDKIS